MFSWILLLATHLVSNSVLALCNTSPATQLQSGTENLAGSGSTLEKVIVGPGKPFRDTAPGELSVASYNILSPTLHALSHPFEGREEHEARDRKERTPLALQIAKQLNADVLCLQEVDGAPEHLEELEGLLSYPGENVKGYDSYVWSPLHPNRQGDIVGLCVAWRSDRHTLVSRHRFRRGMVAQLEENGGGATFSVANLHLPARPSDIYGRLSSVATACRRIEDNRVTSSGAPLDGAAIMVGDFNCNTDSSAIRLLKNGLVYPGILFERNYRHKLTKTNAYKLRHGMKFLDAYGSSTRKAVASVTVSLHGRGPGSMDHVLYMPGRWGKTTKRKGRLVLDKEDRILASHISGRGKRSRRRRRVQDKTTSKVDSAPPALLKAEAVLATIDPNDNQRTSVITSGLPRMDQGFPSDHLPVGVLLSPSEIEEPTRNAMAIGVDGEEINGVQQETSSIQISSIKRGDAHSIRQRHNALVRAISGWLIQRGAIDFIKDEPLYMWKWVEGLEYVKKKMRAPDICCVIPSKKSPSDVAGGTLLMVEVTVAKRPAIVRKQKQKKYQDLAPTLLSSPKVQEEDLSVPSPSVIVVSDSRGLPLETIKTLEYLAALTNDGSGASSDESCAANLGDELLRIRDHWTPLVSDGV